VELHHLRYFIAVAERLSFRRAAEHLHVAQPAVSRAVQQLEEEVGCRLFVRSSRGVALTEEGSRVLGRARSILDSISRISEGLTSQRGEPLRIGHVMPEYLRVGPLSQRAKAFRASFPATSLDTAPMLHRRLLHDLADGRIDVGFGWLPLESVPPGLQVEVVMTDKPAVALPPSHRLASASRVQLRDLRDDTFLLFPRRAMPERYDELVAMVRRAGIEPAIVTQSPNLQAVLASVGEGKGVSIVPRMAAKLHAAAGFVIADIDGVTAQWSLAMVWKPPVRSATVEAFIGAMRPSLSLGE